MLELFRKWEVADPRREHAQFLENAMWEAGREAMWTAYRYAAASSQNVVNVEDAFAGLVSSMEFGLAADALEEECPEVRSCPDYAYWISTAMKLTGCWWRGRMVSAGKWDAPDY
jgi:hypothetical protein